MNPPGPTLSRKKRMTGVAMARMMALGIAGVLLMSSMTSLLAAETGGAKKPIRNGWDSKWFDYDKPKELVVVASTPTAAR